MTWEDWVMLHRLIDVKGPDECWPWRGALDREGYPLGKIDGRMRRVHRAAYEQVNGPIPDGHTIDHDCHNRATDCHGGPCPHRACCNPAHLVARTSEENQRSSPHTYVNRAVCKAGHLLDEGNIYQRKDRPGRQCLACHRRHVSEWRERSTVA